VTQGDMDVPCTGSHNCYTPSGTYGVLSTSNSAYQPAYGTSTGWDFATGIGTVNAYNLVMAFGTTSPTPTPTPTPTGSPSVTPTPTPTPTATPTGVPESLNVKPSPENFGKVKVGHVKSVTLTLSNPAKKGGPPITFGNPLATVLAASPQEFEVTWTCSAALFPTKKCKVTVKFFPAAPGPQSSTITIFDNAANANQVIELQGTGK